MSTPATTHCAQGVAALEYAWSLALGVGAPQPLEGGRVLTLPPHALPCAASSVVSATVTATTAAGERLASNASAPIAPPLEPLLVSVAGGSERSLGVAKALRLDGSASEDPCRLGALGFVWACAERPRRPLTLPETELAQFRDCQRPREVREGVRACVRSTRQGSWPA